MTIKTEKKEREKTKNNQNYLVFNRTRSESCIDDGETEKIIFNKIFLI